jgi:O-methyltransferase involved in polyketide biosynthesis
VPGGVDRSGESSTDSLREKTQVLSIAAATVFVIEGVTMYVTTDSLPETLEVLKTLFADHQLIADPMNRQLIEHYGRTAASEEMARAVTSRRRPRIIAQVGADMIPGDVSTPRLD